MGNAATMTVVLAFACFAPMNAADAAARVSMPTVRMGVGTVRLAPGSSQVGSANSVQVVSIVGSHGHHFGHRHHGGHLGGFGGYGYGYYGYDRYDDYVNDRYASAQALEDLARQYDPQLLGEQAEVRTAPSSDPLETARAALVSGDGATAQLALADLLKSEVDSERAEALLLVGFAQALEEDFEAAGRSFEAAFDADAALKTKPLDGASICGSADRVRGLAQRAAQHAHRAPSREAWFAIGVLVHAQGKVTRANELIARALQTPAVSASGE